MNRISKWVLGAVASGLLLLAGTPAALAGAPSGPVTMSAPADAPASVAPVAGTAVEAADYERREAASPEVQEFAGGAVYIGVGLVFILIVVLIVLVLSD
jgi:outer membrane murein-binding lipoprotein Lpp